MYDQSSTTSTSTLSLLWGRIRQLVTTRSGLWLCISFTILQILLHLTIAIVEPVSLSTSNQIVNCCSTVNCTPDVKITQSSVVERTEALARELYGLDDQVFILEKRIAILEQTEKTKKIKHAFDIQSEASNVETGVQKDSQSIVDIQTEQSSLT